MTSLDSFLQILEEDFQDKYERLLKKGAFAQELFLKNEKRFYSSVLFKNEFPLQHDHLFPTKKQVQIFLALGMFRSELVIKKLESDFQFQPEQLRWFINLTDIKKEFESIVLHGITIYKHYFVALSFCYLLSNYENDVLILYEKKQRKNGKRIVEPEQYWKNFERREKHRNTNNSAKEKEHDSAVKQYYSLFWKEPNSGVIPKKMIRMLKGQEQQEYLKAMFQCFKYDKEVISQNKVFTIVFDLFRLIIQDKLLRTEEEYINSKYFKTASNYQSYKSKSLRKIIFKK